MELKRRQFLQTATAGAMLGAPYLITTRKAFAQGPSPDTGLISSLCSNCFEAYIEMVANNGNYASASAYRNVKSSLNLLIHNLETTGMTAALVSGNSAVAPYVPAAWDASTSQSVYNAATSLGVNLPLSYYAFGEWPAPPSGLVSSTLLSSVSYFNTYGFATSGGMDTCASLTPLQSMLQKPRVEVVPAIYRPNQSGVRLLRVQSGSQQGVALGIAGTSGGAVAATGVAIAANSTSIATGLGVSAAAVGWTGVGLVVVGLLVVGYVGYTAIKYLNNGPVQTPYSQVPQNSGQCKAQ